jgi:hypothetical protein
VVEEGALADLLLVDGNPLENIALVADPDRNFQVIMKGSGPSRTPRQLPGSGHCSPVPHHQCGFDSHHPLHSPLLSRHVRDNERARHDMVPSAVPA